MNWLDKIIGKIQLNFLNRKGSPSQKNVVKMRDSSIASLQQAGRDFYNTPAKTEAPVIEVLTDSNDSNFGRSDEIKPNISIQRTSLEPLSWIECTFDGVPTNHGSRKIDARDVFHFETFDRSHLVDGYEPQFILKVRKQTGEEFLFKAKFRIVGFPGRFELQFTGEESIQPL